MAEKFGLKLVGDKNTPVRGVAPIADARPGQLAFYSTERNSAAFKILPIEVLQNTRATVILVQPENVKHAPQGATLLVTDSPRGNIVKILGEIYREKLDEKDKTPIVVLSTASPYKFPQDVLYALTGNDVKDSFKGVKRLHLLTAMKPPKSLMELRYRT
ncbi:MAG: hypothetical protein II219_01425, partial [Alphaproteobacteria bacterium]|nr:hypothetical protein [Alphaproteobacteria bacterium]